MKKLDGFREPLLRRLTEAVRDRIQINLLSISFSDPWKPSRAQLRLFDDGPPIDNAIQVGDSKETNQVNGDS